MIPLETGIPTIRTSLVEQGGNHAALEVQLDLAEERRERALVRLQAYQGQLARFYNKQVKAHELKIGDLVLRKTLGNMKNPSEGKLGAN